MINHFTNGEYNLEFILEMFETTVLRALSLNFYFPTSVGGSRRSVPNGGTPKEKMEILSAKGGKRILHRHPAPTAPWKQIINCQSFKHEWHPGGFTIATHPSDQPHHII